MTHRCNSTKARSPQITRSLQGHGLMSPSLSHALVTISLQKSLVAGANFVHKWNLRKEVQEISDETEGGRSASYTNKL